MMPELKDKPKYQQVYDELISTFTSRGYKVGDRLPSEREFAAMLDVNVLTVRRAFRELIAADFVSKRVGSGTYLNREISHNWSDHAVNLLIDSRSNSTAQRIFEKCGKDAAIRQNREYRFVYISPGNQREMIRSCVLYRQPTVFCGYIPRYKDFAADIAGGREFFVAVGAMDNPGLLPTVISDDATGVRTMMEHLKSLGHKKIAFLSSHLTGNIPESVLAGQYEMWRSMLKADYSPELFIGQEFVAGDFDQMTAGYEIVRSCVNKVDFTALLCATDDYMFGAMAALTEAGCRIPEDVSVVSIGNTALSRFAVPGVTCADLDFPGLFSEALKLLYRNIANPDDIEMRRTVKPFLVERHSTVKLNTANFNI